MPVVALDVMSGDAGLSVPIAAARRILAQGAECQIILVGDEAAIRKELAKSSGNANDGDKWQIEHTNQVVAMDELPTRAVRKRDTSMRRALELVVAGRADAAVSAGNTGALMGLGVLLLRVIEGISRPAIAAFIPNRTPEYSCCMLDLGANVNCSAEMLRDFALMGSALSQAVKQKTNPTVGLLNIGEEAHKGSETLKQVADLLQADEHINFVGNVEGHAIYGNADNHVDVVVCDGFSGNVALKVSEGVAAMIRKMIHDALRANWFFKLCSVLALPIFIRLRKNFDHRQYNGATFLGLRGVVVKSHGNADEVAFAAAIQCAIAAAKQKLPQIIERYAAVAAAANPPPSVNATPVTTANEEAPATLSAQQA